MERRRTQVQLLLDQAIENGLLLTRPSHEESHVRQFCAGIERATIILRCRKRMNVAGKRCWPLSLSRGGRKATGSLK